MLTPGYFAAKVFTPSGVLMAPAGKWQAANIEVAYLKLNFNLKETTGFNKKYSTFAALVDCISSTKKPS
jgi:hypothetical protein